MSTRSMTNNGRAQEEEVPASSSDAKTMLLELQKQLDELKKRHAEEIAALKEEKTKMKRKLEEVGQDCSKGPSLKTPRSSTPTSSLRSVQAQGSPPKVRGIANTAVTALSEWWWHPFTDDIMEVPPPDNWQWLTIDEYDGTTDPDEHVKVYVAHVSVYSTKDAIFCRAFPTSLKGEAFSWYSELPPMSINCFATLVARFGSRFASSRPDPFILTMALQNIRQEKGEALRTFMERFVKLALKIRNLSPQLAFCCLTIALRPGPFLDSLAMNPTTDLNELRQRAAEYIRLEEARELIGKMRAENSPTDKKAHDRYRHHKSLPRPKEIRQPRFNQYTSKNADMSRYCRYHQKYGHDTEECVALKDKIEELVRAGHLRQFVQRGGHGREGHKRRVESRRTIEDDSDGRTNSRQRRATREKVCAYIC